MKNLICITWFIFLIHPIGHCQQLQWVKTMGAVDSDAANSIAIDVAGNVYTTGFFEGTVDFDPGNDVFELTSSGSWDIFVLKLDASGNFVWAVKMGGTNVDAAYSIALDSQNNILITGAYGGTCDFDPGDDLLNFSSAGVWDIFIVKLSNNGDLIWAKSMGGAEPDYGRAIAVDLSGNIYLTGDYAGTVDFNPGLAVFNLSSPSPRDLFVCKLNSSGNFIWAKSTSGDCLYPVEMGLSLVVDVSGNVYVAGAFMDNVDFDPGPEEYILSSYNGGNTDAFILKLNSSGSFLWAKQFGHNNHDKICDLVLDPMGNILSVGAFFSTVDFDSGDGVFEITSIGDDDAFVMKMDSDGNFVWVKVFSGIEAEVGLSIALDSFNSIYVTGYFSETTDFNPEPEIFELTTSGDYDIFISKLDALGNFEWASSMGSIEDDWGNSIVIDASGNIITTGFFEETADFDPELGVFNIASQGSYDIFIHKMSQPVGIEENTIFNTFNIYPNPSNGVFTFQTQERLKTTFLVTDIRGGSILFGTINDRVTTIDLSSFASGLYFLHVENSVVKLVKQ
jgi:hypothetical protein